MPARQWQNISVDMEYNDLLDAARAVDHMSDADKVTRRAVSTTLRAHSHPFYWAAAAVIAVMLMPFAITGHGQQSVDSMVKTVHQQTALAKADPMRALKAYHRSQQMKTNIKKYENISLR